MLRIDGCERAEHLLDALEQVVRRHGALRSKLHGIPHEPFVVQSVAIDRIGTGSAGADEPLHVECEEMGPGSHRMVLRGPAATLDARSLETIASELAAVLGGIELAPDPVQFAELSDWRNEVVGSRMADVDPTARPRRTGFAVHRVQHDLSPSGSTALEGLARSIGRHRRDVVLAAWMTYRWRLGTERSCIVAVAHDGRDADPLLHDVVGAATAYLPVTVELEPSLPFSVVVQRARGAREAAVALAEPGLARMPENVVALDIAPRCRRHTVGRVTVELSAADARTAPFGRRLTWDPDAARLVLELDAGEGPAIAAERALDGLVRLVGAATARPTTAIGDLPVVGAAEEAWLATVSRGPRRPVPTTPVASIVAAGQAHPERVAVRDGHTELRYGELVEHGRHVARALGDLGVARGDHVVVVADRSVWTLVSMVAVMLAGAAYVPLDEGVPPARLRTIIDDCAAPVVMARRDVDCPEPVVRLDPASTAASHHRISGPGRPAVSAGAPVVSRTLDDSAYVLYTSGSTGRPKGVVVSDRGLANYVGWAVEHYGLAGPGEAVVTSPFGFDLTVTTSLAPLCVGGTVVVAPNASPVDALSMIDPGRGVSALKLTPRHLELLTSQLGDTGVAGTVRTVVVGGEALNRDTVARWREHSAGSLVVNEYGPTETVVGSAFHDVPLHGDDRADVPIGSPIDNTSLYVLDGALRLVPTGVVGELFIAGMGVAHAYLGATAQTAARFLPDPFADGARMYRTGDLVRRDHDGELTYLGRVDDQLKIRGFRVEPGEVEQVLASHGSVRAAVVVPSGQALVAFVVGDEPTDDVDLWQHAAARLPEHMVPARFVRVRDIPLTSNGKVDRALLARTARSTAATRAPETELERRIADVWCSVLGLDRVGSDQSFFEVGGESLLAIEVVRQLQERLERPLRVAVLFEHPTVGRLASFLSRSDDGDAVDAGAARAAKRRKARARAQPRGRPR